MQATINSPLGPLLATFDEHHRLNSLHFQDDDQPPTLDKTTAHPAAEELARQLAAYFAGDPAPFNIPLAPQGTPFQQQVWHHLQQIPRGHTISYSTLARRTRSVARAVGQANGANPIAILIPCHRVIAADSTLGGYAGGLWRKEKLLALECADAPLSTGA
jgi:methylated-DNA-[protein]-cysteine S-methyltransferase